LKRSQKRTRIADIAPDGLTSDHNEKVATIDVLDIQAVDISSSLPCGPNSGIVGERGTITIPSDMRRRAGLQPGSPVLIEERGDEIVIRPADIVPRRRDPHQTLDGLLAGVTAENIHGEVSTGAAVGGEAW
jgi:AbrB family looped-hinge helix DNA binding protein